MSQQVTIVMKSAFEGCRLVSQYWIDALVSSIFGPANGNGWWLRRDGPTECVYSLRGNETVETWVMRIYDLRMDNAIQK